MTPKQFAALATVAALSLIAAVAVHSLRAPWTGESLGTGKLFPALASEAASVSRIVVTQGGKPLTIERDGEVWRVASQDGYPAMNEKVRALLLSLTDAKLLEPKTRVPDRYALLEVDDPAGKSSNARLITLEDAGGRTLGEIIAGKQRAATPAAGQGTGGTYVRKPGDEQSWLASTAISGGSALKDWANPRVFETQTERIKSLTVEIRGEPPYTLKRNDDGSHALAAIPAGKKVKYVNMIDNIIEAASFLDFERVRKRPATSGPEAGVVRFETDGGLAVALHVRRDKDGTWVTVDPSGEGDAKKAADDIRARTDGWEFEVLPSKAETMLKKEADLIEDIEASAGGTPHPGAGAPFAVPAP
jgi:hypothetical protein